MKITDSTRTKNIMYSWGVLSMLLILSFTALIALQYGKLAVSSLKTGVSLISKLKAMALSGSMALLTTLINFILSSSMELLSKMEKHKTKSERLKSLVFKTIVSQSINTCFLYGILHLVKPSYNILNSYGLVYQIMSLITISSLVTLLLQAAVPGALYNDLINHFKIDKTK